MSWTGSRSRAGSQKGSPWYAERSNAKIPDQTPPAYEPDRFRARFTLLRRADNLSEAHQAHLDRLFSAHPRLKVASERAPRALPDLRSRRPRSRQPSTRTVRRSLRQRPDTANTTTSWKRSSPAVEENTGLPPRQTSIQPATRTDTTTCTLVLRRVAHGFTNHDNYPTRGLLVT